MVRPNSAPLPDWVLARRRRIGEQIRQARLHANLTQQAVGERTGIDRSAIIGIEYGRSAPSIDTLLLIADAIGVPLAELVR
ncbi:helix-turn-helix transcriptional regulator [Streptomyces sp.]|uniref:helix-turn-helix domain-containing protein n=1 Tax=Streptomyces sp. TaxID=1931 RepID=UPI002F943C6C